MVKSCQYKMSDNPASLKCILFGVYLWTDKKCCDFFHDTGQVLKKNGAFKSKLDAGSAEVFGTSDFVEMMGTEYWDILHRCEKGDPKYFLDEEKSIHKKKWVTQLLIFLRDKYEHMHQYTQAVKLKLNDLTTNGRQFKFFYEDGKDQWKLNENQFIAFCNFKFPKLMPYLWLTFYELRHALENHYPATGIKIGDLKKAYSDLGQYDMGIRNALQCALEKGNVFKRYEGAGHSIEFRGLDQTAIILGTNDFVRAAVNVTDKIALSVSNSSTGNTQQDYFGTTPAPTKKLILIVANTIEDDEDKVWPNFANCANCRVVVFCDRGKLNCTSVEKAVDKFSTANNLNPCQLVESPVKGSKLSVERQKWLFERGQLLVQQKVRNIKDIYPDDREIVWELEGEMLNKLLRGTIPVLRDNLKKSPVKDKDVYVDRQLICLDLDPNASSAKEKKACHIRYPLHVLVNTPPDIISNVRPTEHLKTFKNVQQLLLMKECIKDDCVYILLEEPTHISEQLVQQCEDELCPRSLQFNEFDDIFSSDLFLDMASCRASELARKAVGEDEFLQRISRQGVKTVCIQAESGQGKSQLLQSFKKRLRDSLVIDCPFAQFVALLEKRVGAGECSKEDVKSVIFEIMGCRDNCARKLVDKWLERRGNNGTKIELQLDGLEQVTSSQLAWRVVQIVDTEFDSVRLWITSSQPFELREMSTLSCYTIAPFSRNDQVEYFKRSWSAKCLGELSESQLTSHINLLLDKLVSERDLELPANFLGSPLHCECLANKFKDKVRELDELRKLGCCVDVFESIYHTKFDIMYREKEAGNLGDNQVSFKLQKEVYLEMHTYLALVYSFPSLSAEFTRPSVMEGIWTEEYFHKMGVITSSEPLVFISPKYADFLVARYITTVLKTGKLSNLCSSSTFYNLLYFGCPDGCENSQMYRYSMWLFVENYLGKVADWSRTLNWLKTHQKDSPPSISGEKGLSQFLLISMSSGMWYLALLLIFLWVDPEDEISGGHILELALQCQVPSNWFIGTCDILKFGNSALLLDYSKRAGRPLIAQYLTERWCGGGNVLSWRGGNSLQRFGDDGSHLIADPISMQSCQLVSQTDFVQQIKSLMRLLREVEREEELRRRDIGRFYTLLASPILQSDEPLNIKCQQILELRQLVMERLGDHNLNGISFDGGRVLGLGDHLYSDNIFESVNLLIYVNTFRFLKRDLNENLMSMAFGFTPLRQPVYCYISKGNSFKRFRQLGRTSYYCNSFIGKGDTTCQYFVRNREDIEFIRLLSYGCGNEVRNWECSFCVAKEFEKVGVISSYRKGLKFRETATCELTCVKYSRQGGNYAKVLGLGKEWSSFPMGTLIRLIFFLFFLSQPVLEQLLILTSGR